MSEIRVDDLVVVVRESVCCHDTSHIGRIYTVSGFYHGYRCRGCGKDVFTPCAMLDGKWAAYPLNELKRIDPPAEDETVTTDEEITA